MGSDDNKRLVQSISLNGLTWAKTLMICVILLCGGVATYFGANVSMNFSFQARLENLENRIDIPVNSSLSGLQKPYDYIISTVDAYFCLQNGTDGKLNWFSTNKTAVETAAVGNLTSGGTILLKGCTLDPAVAYGSNILIVEDYQGTRNYYGSNSFWYNGQNRTGVLANPESTANYIIDYSGSSYRKINCTTGQVDSSNTDFRTVALSAFSSLANGGGKVFLNIIGNATVSGGTLLIDNNNIEVYGIYGATCLVQTSVGAHNLFDIANSSANTYVSGIYIHDLTLICTNSSELCTFEFANNCTAERLILPYGHQEEGIVSYFCTNIKARNNFIFQVGGGSGTWGLNPPMQLYDSSFCEYTDNYIDKQGGWSSDGIMITGTNGGVYNPAHNNIVANNIIKNPAGSGIIIVNNAYGNIIEGNQIYNPGGCGISSGSFGANHNKLAFNWIYNASSYGILAGSGDDIEDNTINGTGIGATTAYYEGIHLYFCNDVSMVHNTILNCNGSGIDVVQSLRTQIVTNTVDYNKLTGIVLYYGTNASTVTANILDNNSQASPNTYAAISITGYGSDGSGNNTVQSNIITGSAHKYCVQLDSLSFSNKVKGNIMMDASTSPVLDSGTGNEIEDYRDAMTINPTINTNLSAQGIFASGTVGQSVVAGQLLFMNSSGKYWVASATSTATMPVVAMAASGASANGVCTILFQGYFRNDSWSLTVGSIVYVSTTSGDIVQSYPSATGNQVEVVGYAVSATEIYFRPNLDIVEIA